MLFLPAYAPELNPDEYLNRDLKTFLAYKTHGIREKSQLKDNVQKQLRSIQRQPRRVRNYFKHPKVGRMYCSSSESFHRCSSNYLFLVPR